MQRTNAASEVRMLGILRMLGRLTSGERLKTRELGFAFAPRNETLASKEQMLKRMLALSPLGKGFCPSSVSAAWEPPQLREGRGNRRSWHAKNTCFGMQRTHASASEVWMLRHPKYACFGIQSTHASASEVCILRHPKTGCLRIDILFRSNYCQLFRYRHVPSNRTS